MKREAYPGAQAPAREFLVRSMSVFILASFRARDPSFDANVTMLGFPLGTEEDARAAVRDV